MKPILREPLVHFLLLGAVLFAGWQFLQPPRLDDAASREIRLSLAEISQLAVLFQSQWKREPTPAELARLVEDRVKEEVLYREALALGLDKDDTIVKRRLAQKMEFLAEDVAATHEPTTADLQVWYEKNAAQFAMPSRFSFRHLYFSPDRRGDKALADATRALEKLAGQPEDTKLAATLADPFMFQDHYRDRAPDFLGKEFGPRFAQAIAKLTPRSWQGPVESGFGWHLVFVDTSIPGRVPDFDEVAADVRTAWLTEQKALASEKAYRDMRAKYTVLLPKPPDEQGPARGASEAAVTRPVDETPL